MIAHKWQPISPLTEECGYDFFEIDALQRRWTAYRQEREALRPDAYDAFLERLTRSWAIETGIIEGLYTLDRGITETLVMRGISADLIERNSTDIEPQELAILLGDHQNAVQGVYTQIRHGTPITRIAIQQIHETLTCNQPTFRAMDQFGHWFNAQLHHGQFKKLPNNPTRRDGTIHEYCPPEQVDSELDNLLAWYNHYTQDNDRHHPLLTASWLHHRFTQVHPFEDGNGRVVRTLLTWHLVREGYLPIVVNRDDRVAYIDALENADDGDLVPFVDLLVNLQRKTILSALEAHEDSEPPRLIDEAVEYLVGRVRVRYARSEDEIPTANTVAEALRDRAADWIEGQAEKVCAGLQQAGNNVTSTVDRGGPGVRESRYDGELARVTKDAGYPVNPAGARFFIELSLTPAHLTRWPKLIFVVSLHHAGHQFTGIMAANVFGRTEHYRYDKDDPILDEPVELFTEYWYHTNNPFIFTMEDDAGALMPRFTEWAEQHLALALRDWGERFA